MNKPKFTPGPWICVDTSYHAHDYRLLPLDNCAKFDQESARANARLISVAPEMYNLLHEIIDNADIFPYDSDLVAKAMALLEKAGV
jgi:hypothetical protein